MSMTMGVRADVLDIDAGALRIVVSEVGPTTTLALYGEWDLASTDTIHQVHLDALTRQPQCVVLDLSQLTFIDSSGIHGTVELVRRAHAQNIGLAIIPGPRAVRRVFEITQLSERLPFVAAA